jgi:hypothetical protein
MVITEGVPRFEALYSGPGYCGGLVGRIAVIVGRDRPDPPLPEHGYKWTKRLSERYPEGCGFMIVLRSEAPPPNDDTRARVSGFFEGCAKNATAGAVVIEGNGFVAASIRGFFGVYSLAAYRFRLKVYGTVEEAAPAMMKRLGRGDPQEAADLFAGINALKAAYADGTLRVNPGA